MEFFSQITAADINRGPLCAGRMGLASLRSWASASWPRPASPPASPALCLPQAVPALCSLPASLGISGNTWETDFLLFLHLVGREVLACLRARGRAGIWGPPWGLGLAGGSSPAHACLASLPHTPSVFREGLSQLKRAWWTSIINCVLFPRPLLLPLPPFFAVSPPPPAHHLYSFPSAAQPALDGGFWAAWCPHTEAVGVNTADRAWCVNSPCFSL